MKKGSFTNSETPQTMSRQTLPLAADKHNRYKAESSAHAGGDHDLSHLPQPTASSTTLSKELSDRIQDKSNRVGVEEARSIPDGQSNKKKNVFLNRQRSSAETDDDDHNSTIITSRNVSVLPFWYHLSI